MLRRLTLAIQFLTIIPLGITSEVREQDYGRALFYFPFVGIGIGVLCAGIFALGASLPISVIAVMVLIISTLITGGLHLDGFADTCDGFSGGKNKEGILAIMRDSRIGAMGAVGIVLLLLLKWVLIVSMPDALRGKSLIMMMGFSRWIQTVGCLLPAARKEGKAVLFISHAKKRDVVVAGTFVLMLFLWCAGEKGFLCFLGAFVPVVCAFWYFFRKIGGMTGDTLGSVSEIAEVSILFLFEIGQ